MRSLSRHLPTLFVLLYAVSLSAKDPIHYHVEFPHRIRHEAQITLHVNGLKPGPQEFAMSRSSPGRYALHEFAKNVYHIQARDSRGEQLKVERVSTNRWRVPQHDGTVQFSYTLFANRADGTYSGISEKHAHFNMPATFMWAHGHDEREIEIHFEIPKDSDWSVSTQLQKVNREESLFRAPNLYYFMDSPTRLAKTSRREWPVQSNGLKQTIRLDVHHQGTEEQVDRYAEMAKKVVSEQIAIFGEVPKFDFGTYTFIASYVPYVHGDGMEHRNSTILTSRSSLSNPMRVLGTLSHEFIHAWNVERIRPHSLKPFNFEDRNPCAELWFAEGFTSYYTDLAIVRAGLIDASSYAQRLSYQVNTVLTHPGRQFHSPQEMSLQALFVDAASSIDPTNRKNTFISYYTYGSALGLALDLTLRSKFEGISLDDYMKLLWQVHGKREIPYSHHDLKDLLGVLTKDQAFAEEFFARYIEGKEAPPYAALLDRAGFILQDVNNGRNSLGNVSWSKVESGLQLTSNPRADSPLYELNIVMADILEELDGTPMKEMKNLQQVLDSKKHGDSVEALFSRGERKIKVTAHVSSQPRFIVKSIGNNIDPASEDAEADEPKISSSQIEFRKNWLGQKGNH